MGRLRLLRRARFASVCAGLLLVVLAAFTLALCTGDLAVPVADVWSTLLGGGDAGTRFVVVELRLPRALLALLVGFCLGLSGALFQALLRNPLASPDVIGVSSGAAVTAVVASLVYGVSGLALSGAALTGALAAGAAVYLLAWRRGVNGHRLVLIGVGVGAGLSSVVSYLMTRSEVTEAQSAFVWLAGSLNARSWPHFWPLLLASSVLVPLTFAASRTMPALQLGDGTAAGLGARVERDRLALLACATALAGVATAAAGPVGFVAFVAPPVARRLLPGHGAALLPAALAGAALTAPADLLGQHLLPQTQLPVGIVTSVVGAPYLLWLLARANRVGTGG
ncbi:iron chelate uptake ABC transporter family permease subunit [Streptomyces sp. NPDC005840]|uniref:Iron chelate uptake ABC transporter family permease subunit n=1 Tax=Streptomyces doudnae TaxID=3075536 RepID=A0ABD5EVD3_9ACTN|nr:MULTISPECIES: iron chelate uptake ABC transporter family permease subunit [unclassified Streptomyces]MDT0437347.1 iron chelate uptake ABC transporter family permease subunit [Streptomyces sp. DSM 41981]